MAGQFIFVNLERQPNKELKVQKKVQKLIKEFSAGTTAQ
jgi:hypothetical protein